MAGGSLEHWQSAGGMDNVGKQPGFIPVLQGSDIGGSSVQFGFMVILRRNNEGGGGNPLGVPL